MSGNMNMTICGSNQVIAIEYWMMTAPEVFSDFCALRFIEAYAFEVEGQSEPFPKRHVTANQNPLSATLVCIGRCTALYVNQISTGLSLTPHDRSFSAFNFNRDGSNASDRKDPSDWLLKIYFQTLYVDEFRMLPDVVQPELSVHPSRPTPPRHLHLSGGDLRLDTATEYIQSFGARVEDLEIRQRTQGYSGCLWRKELTVEEEAFLYVSVLDPIVCGAFLSDQFVNDKGKL
ncbi:hypothetical protein EV368DRAFT_64815 [Lentinula lateritia]|nr:hypothetical protein EV368DRAFT_64815 [Lentinula lateritia]